MLIASGFRATLNGRMGGDDGVTKSDDIGAVGEVVAYANATSFSEILGR